MKRPSSRSSANAGDTYDQEVRAKTLTRLQENYKKIAVFPAKIEMKLESNFRWSGHLCRYRKSAQISRESLSETAI